MSDRPKESRAARKRCFVVSAFGKTPEEQRTHKQVLRHLVQKVLDDKYEVVRADQIDDEGLITNQIIEHLLEDDLVVADLTGLNPNVFYEVAVRHAARKPIVHLITKGQEIPFDVANMRAVAYALDDPDALEEAQAELTRKVKSIEANGFKAAANPVSAARDVWLLRESELPEARDAGNLLGAFNELRDEVRLLGRRVGGGTKANDKPRGALRMDDLKEELARIAPATPGELAKNLGVDVDLAEWALKRLAKNEHAIRLEDGFWVPL